MSTTTKSKGLARLAALAVCAGFAGSASARQTQRPGFKVPATEAGDDSGKVFDIKSLAKDKPVFLVYFHYMRDKFGIADMNRLSRMMAGKVRVVGVFLPDEGRISHYAKKYRVGFTLVNSYPAAMELDDWNGAVRTGYNALLLPNGRVTHVWYGYSRATLKRMQEDALKYAGITLLLDLSKFPKDLQIGDGGNFGLGH